MSRRVTVNLIAFLAIFVLMLWWAVNNIISFGFIERPYEISGEFVATAGVSDSSEVAYLGVNHGSVSGVELVDGKVVISMAIDREKRIPEGSIARIFRKSAVGEPYIDFAPPEGYTDGGPYMEPGTVIPLERTQVPLEFSELLRAASRVIGSVEPEKTRTLIRELAVALNGRSAALRSLVVDSDALLETFADRTELLDRLSANSTQLTRTVTEHRGSLSSAIGDLAAVAESLRAVDPDTRVLLERGTELLTETADLVDDVEGELDCVLSDLDALISATTTDEQLGYLAKTLDDGPTAFNYVFMTTDTEPGGVWVRVHIITPTENPARTYVPPHQLPEVPQVPPCTSNLESTAQAPTTDGPVRRLAVGEDAVRAELSTATLASPPAGSDRQPLAAVLWIGAGAVLAAATGRRRTP